MDQQQRLEAVEAENDELRERIAQLEAQLFGAGEWLPPLEWQLTEKEARIMGVLVARERATKDAIMTALYREFSEDEAEPKIVDVFVCKIRGKLKPYGIAIATIWGQGYCIPADQRAQLKGGAVAIAPPEAAE